MIGESQETRIRQVLDIAVCPGDRASLVAEPGSGQLRCASCDRIYDIWRGVPFLTTDHKLCEVTEGLAASGCVRGTNAAEEYHRYHRDRIGEQVDHTEIARWLGFFLGVLAGRFENQTILDLGAGRCDYSWIVAERCPAARVVALDLIPTRMAEARDRGAPGNLQFVAGSAYALPFRDATFDVVYGSMILHHLSDLHSAASEISRVLKAGGTYFGAEPNLASAVGWLGFTLAEKSSNEYPIRQSQIEDAFRAAGMQVATRYFWRRFGWARTRRTGSCLAIAATKVGPDAFAEKRRLT
jgi:SAM-dependent methyltransferase/uncharacterized protein YbaR (Trm112 family)